MKKSDFLKEIYFDATSTIRHYDTQRTGFTQLVLSALTVMIGFIIALSKPETPSLVLQGLAVVGMTLSIAGFVIAGKLGTLISRQRNRARLALEKLEAEWKDSPISEIDAELKAGSKDGIFSGVKLETIWSCIFIIYLVFNVGIFAVYCC